MFKAKRRIALSFVYIFVTVLFISIAVFLVPQTKINDFNDYSNLFPSAVTAILFCLLIMIASTIYGSLRIILEKRSMRTGGTAYISAFIEKLRSCYSLEDFYQLIATIFEEQADCSVLYVDSETNYVIYNSPTRIVAAEGTAEKLEMNYTSSWKDE